MAISPSGLFVVFRGLVRRSVMAKQVQPAWLSFSNNSPPWAEFEGQLARLP